MISHVPSRQHDEFAANMSRLLDPVRFCDVGFAVPEVESAMTLVAYTFSTSSELAGQPDQRTYGLSKMYSGTVSRMVNYVATVNQMRKSRTKPQRRGYWRRRAIDGRWSSSPCSMAVSREPPRSRRITLSPSTVYWPPYALA